MAGRRIHIPEDYSDKDMSRALFDRPTGRIGIYLELGDAVPIDAHGHASQTCFLHDTEDKLDKAIRQVTLEKVKGAFERKLLLNDVIFEEYHGNLVISVSFEHSAGIADLWDAYNKELLTPCLQKALITSDVLRDVGVKSLVLECRVWEDEIEGCQKEIQEGNTVQVKLENSKRDQALIREVKKYLPTLAERLMLLKDDLNKFDKNLGEFIMIMKRYLPNNVEKIFTYNEFAAYVEHIKKKCSENKQGKILDLYSKVREALKVTIEDFEDNVMHRLLQVHVSCENQYQQDMKAKVRAALRETKTHLHTDYNFCTLNPKEWQAKVLQSEQSLFLGLISVLPRAVTTLVDADIQIDEYISSLTVKIRG